MRIGSVHPEVQIALVYVLQLVTQRFEARCLRVLRSSATRPVGVPRLRCKQSFCSVSNQGVFRKSTRQYTPLRVHLEGSSKKLQQLFVHSSDGMLCAPSKEPAARAFAGGPLRLHVGVPMGGGVPEQHTFKWVGDAYSHGLRRGGRMKSCPMNGKGAKR